MPTPFHFPPAPRDPMLARLGAAERGSRALLKRVLAPTAPAIRDPRPDPGPDRPASIEEGRATGAVLYLPALAWAYRYQRPQQMAVALSTGPTAVLYVDGFDRSRFQPRRRLCRVASNLWVLHMAVPGRPDPYRQQLASGAARSLADTIIGGLSATPRFLLVQLPFWLPLAAELRERLSCPLVYDRIDLHGGFAGVPPSVSRTESRLLELADLVTATSPDLAERSLPLAREVALLPNAVRLEDFPLLEAPPGRAPGSLRVGYVGALHHWFDVDSVRAAALARPGWSFVLAGRLEDGGVARLGELPNVTLSGEIEYPRVATFLADLDAALVPFRDLPLTRAVDPVKVYEALAVGVPVVARELPGIRRWREPAVFTYEAPDELAAQVDRAVGTDTPEIHRWRRSLVGGDTWERRAAALLDRVPPREPEP